MIDITTFLGIAIALASLLMGIVMEGGNLMSYVGISAAVIIFGGTIGATVVCFPLKTILSIPQLFIIAFTEKSYDMKKIITSIIAFAEKSRREGILTLEAEVANIEDTFLKRGIQLVVDGTEPELVRDILETYIAAMEERHHQGAGVFEAAGGFAPTMGIIGTVLGLINVLSNIKDPNELAGAIALAFIATLYGIFSANILWLPIANKLKNKHKIEKVTKEIMLEGILSLQSGDNPRMVEEKLKSFLSQSFAKSNFPQNRK